MRFSKVIDPEGVAAISRWLSEATPPVRVKKMNWHPEGVQASCLLLASLRDAPFAACLPVVSLGSPTG